MSGYGMIAPAVICDRLPSSVRLPPENDGGYDYRDMNTHGGNAKAYRFLVTTRQGEGGRPAAYYIPNEGSELAVVFQSLGRGNIVHRAYGGRAWCTCERMSHPEDPNLGVHQGPCGHIRELCAEVCGESLGTVSGLPVVQAHLLVSREELAEAITLRVVVHRSIGA